MTELSKSWVTQTLKEWGMNAQSGFASGVHNSEGNGVIHLRPMNVSRLGKLDFENYKSVIDESSRRILKGDILFNNTNSAELVGKTAIVDVEGDFAFSNHMTRLRFPLEKVVHEYMAILLHSFWMSGYFNEICSNHVNQASVSIKRLEQVEVSLPPVDEQHKIVELLEGHLSRLDLALADVKQAKVKATQFRRSLLQSAFTGNLGSGVTRLMTNWNTCKLSDVVELVSGFAFKSADWQDSGVPVLKITNVRNGRVALEGCSYISKKLADESVNFQVKKGDLLITLTGEIGATGFYSQDFEARLNQRVGKIVTKNEREVDLKFVAYFLESPQAREIMWATAKGIAQANISPKEVLNLDIPFPPLEIQNKIVEILESHLSRLDISVSMAGAMEKQSSGLRRSLLQAAFTGQLTKGVVSV